MSKEDWEKIQKEIEEMELDGKELQEIEDQIESEINGLFRKQKIMVRDKDGNLVEKEVYIDKDGNIFTEE